MAESPPLRPQTAFRTDSRPCAPSYCPTPSCTTRSSSTGRWSSPSSKSGSRQPGSGSVPPSWWTTWTLSASPSQQQSRAKPHPAADGAIGQAGGQRQQGKKERTRKKLLQWHFKTARVCRVVWTFREGRGHEEDWIMMTCTKRLCACSWRISTQFNPQTLTFTTLFKTKTFSSVWSSFRFYNN